MSRVKLKFSLRWMLVAISAIAFASYFVGRSFYRSIAEARISETWRQEGATAIFDSYGSLNIVIADSERFDPTILKKSEHLKSLEHLVLRRTRVKDEDLTRVGELNALKSIALNDTEVSDVAVSYIANIEGLQILHLQNTHVSDRCVSDLLKLRRLRYIDIRGCCISKKAKRRLTDGLPKTQVVTD